MFGIPDLQSIITLVIISGLAVVVLFFASADATENTAHTTETTGKQSAREAPLPHLDSVYFACGSTVITPEARQIIVRNAAILQMNPELKVILISHTDGRGSDELCTRLGLRQAKAVQHHLLSLGIAPKRVTYVSRDKVELVLCQDETTLTKNQRVEFKLVK